MVAEGYKETEIGVIPVEWEVVKLEAIANFTQGIQVPIEEQSLIKKDGLVRFIRIVDYTQQHTEIRYVENKGDRYFANENDIVMVRYGVPGLIGRRIKGQIANNLFKINLEQTKANNNFFEFMLSSQIVQGVLQSGIASTTMPAINFSSLNRIKIPLPPLKEQEKIADILSTTDEKIDAIALQIQKAQTLKKGLLQKLLSEGIGHSEFKDSELGKIPESWEIVKLGSISKIKDGTHFSPKSKDGSCKYVTSKNIRFGHFDETTISYISQEEHDKIYKSCPVKKGQVLLTKDGANTGNACLNPLDEPFSLLSSVAVIDGIKDSLYNEYLLQWLLSSLGQKSLKNSMAGQAITRLTLTKISAHKLIFPPLKEQKQIADILSTADEKLEVLRAKKEKYETLKKGLLQKLLSGEVRV